jgi:hypothetical protein
MSNRPAFGTVFWGLGLIAIGAALLARNLGFEVPIWRTVATYWPLLLIVHGSARASACSRRAKSCCSSSC